MFLNVSSGYLGDAGSVTVSAVDEGGCKGISSVPVVVGDAPFVCQTVKGRVVARVRSGGAADMKLSCGLKYGVRPIASVSVSGGAAEDRFGEFVPRVDQATGDVSLRVSVNDGVVGTFTRSLLLRNGDISVRVPVDVIVDDRTQEGTEGSASGSDSSTSGGKYNSPTDTPGPKSPQKPENEKTMRASKVPIALDD